MKCAWIVKYFMWIGKREEKNRIESRVLWNIWNKWPGLMWKLIIIEAIMVILNKNCPHTHSPKCTLHFNVTDHEKSKLYNMLSSGCRQFSRFMFVHVLCPRVQCIRTNELFAFVSACVCVWVERTRNRIQYAFYHYYLLSCGYAALHC